MSQEQELSGEEIMRQNMAAFESGEELPYKEDDITPQLEVVPDIEEPEEPDIPEIAKRDGYIPMTKDEWVASGRDPDKYMTPEEFARVGELRDSKELSKQALAKQNVQLESMMRDVLKNQERMIKEAAEKAREQALAEINAQQQEAIELGDTEKALELERKRLEHSKVEEKPEAPHIEPAIQEWYDKNQHWFNVDQQARLVVESELSRWGNLPPDQAIAKADEKARKHFPQYFDDAPSKPSRPQSPVAQSRKPAVGGKRKPSFNDIENPELRAMAMRVAKASGQSEQEYMELYNG